MVFLSRFGETSKQKTGVLFSHVFDDELRRGFAFGPTDVAPTSVGWVFAFPVRQNDAGAVVSQVRAGLMRMTVDDVTHGKFFKPRSGRFSRDVLCRHIAVLNAVLASLGFVADVLRQPIAPRLRQFEEYVLHPVQVNNAAKTLITLFVGA